MRVGIGFDVHKLETGKPLILGGVTIPHPHGLSGHSDADVLGHSLIDAMLGAAALGDIGSHFPSSDAQYAGMSSLLLLAKINDLITANGWQLTNLDATIVAERPMLSPYIDAMRSHLCNTLGMRLDEVSIKAKSTNGVGHIGREEGISAHAIVGIEQI